jgi:hypothetical protein
MIVTCPRCGIYYDDVYKLTICPHNKFEMNCTVGRGDKILGVAHSPEELQRMLADSKPK